jgi:two-component system aerobic respiration control protein ArcA
LLIEDDEAVRKALKRILEDEGLNVRAASDGTQLASVLEAGAIDLMILDVGLPWINGIELAQLLKQHQDLRRIPLIFISGHTAESEIRAAFAAGADDYIKKPFDVEHVKKTVRVLLQLNQRG